jgi:hypothetical protein
MKVRFESLSLYTRYTVPMTPLFKQLLAILVIVITGLAAYNAFRPQAEVPVGEGVPQETSQGKPTFSWKYATDESGEIPQTTISLIASYPARGATKVIDTIEGTCNAYVSPDADVYAQSEMIICYYAGFGRYYKVVEKNGIYQVQRREFEEASPDYNPPVASFETIATF